MRDMTKKANVQNYTPHVRTADLSRAIRDSHTSDIAFFDGIFAMQVFSEKAEVLKEQLIQHTNTYFYNEYMKDTVLSHTVKTMWDTATEQFGVRYPTTNIDENTWNVAASYIEKNIQADENSILEDAKWLFYSLHGSMYNQKIRDRTPFRIFLTDSFGRKPVPLDTLLLSDGATVPDLSAHAQDVESILRFADGRFQNFPEVLLQGDKEFVQSMGAAMLQIYTLLSQYGVAAEYYAALFEKMLHKYDQDGHVELCEDWFHAILASFFLDADYAVENDPEYADLPAAWKYPMIEHYLPTVDEFLQTVDNMEKVLFARRMPPGLVA